MALQKRLWKKNFNYNCNDHVRPLARGKDKVTIFLNVPILLCIAWTWLPLSYLDRFIAFVTNNEQMPSEVFYVIQTLYLLYYRHQITFDTAKSWTVEYLCCVIPVYRKITLSGHLVDAFFLTRRVNSQFKVHNCCNAITYIIAYFFVTLLPVLDSILRQWN